MRRTGPRPSAGSPAGADRCAEVSLDDPRIGADLRRGPFGDLLTEVEHDDPLADRADRAHVVLDVQDRRALRVQVADQLQDAIELDRRHAAPDLVEAYELGPGRERAGELEQLEVPDGEVARGRRRERLE